MAPKVSINPIMYRTPQTDANTRTQRVINLKFFFLVFSMIIFVNNIGLKFLTL